MPSQGPNSPSAAANQATAGVAWNHTSDVFASDNAYASAAITGQGTKALLITDFGFSVPSTATVLGIQVEIERYNETAAMGVVEDSDVVLYRGGSIIGDDKADSGVAWPLTDPDTYKVYGGPTDLWGATWTPAQINGSDFGVWLTAIETAFDAAEARIDHVRITVTYSDATAELPLTQTSRPLRTRTAMVGY